MCVCVRACVRVCSSLDYVMTYCRVEEVKSNEELFIDWQPKLESWTRCDPKCVPSNHVVVMVYIIKLFWLWLVIH